MHKLAYAVLDNVGGLDHLSRISRLLDEMKGHRLTRVCATLAVKSYRMATP